MGIVDTAQAALSGFGMEQAIFALVALCLLLVVLMGAALAVLSRRSRRAEEKLRALSMETAQQLSSVEKLAEQSGSSVRQEVDRAMQGFSESMLRMMGEMTRTQQGQMDALGGQLRAAGRQEE